MSWRMSQFQQGSNRMDGAVDEYGAQSGISQKGGIQKFLICWLILDDLGCPYFEKHLDRKDCKVVNPVGDQLTRLWRPPASMDPAAGRADGMGPTSLRLLKIVIRDHCCHQISSPVKSNLVETIWEVQLRQASFARKPLMTSIRNHSVQIGIFFSCVPELGRRSQAGCWEGQKINPARYAYSEWSGVPFLNGFLNSCAVCIKHDDWP